MGELRIGGHRGGWRARVVAAALLGLLAVPLPATAAPEPGPDDAAAEPEPGPDAVAAALERWREADETVDAAEARRVELIAALAAAEADEAAAAERLDTETALLVERERELADAEAALRDAEAAAAAALAAVAEAVRSYERALDAAHERRAELGAAAATAYANGDPQLRVLNSLVHALDQTRNVTDFLASTERLAYVTRDARGRFDLADDLLQQQADGALDAARALAQRRAAEQAAAATLAAADAAAAEQRERRDAELEAHEAALELVGRLAAERADAEAELTSAQAARVAAISAARPLGWYAGVPGPAGLVWPVDGRPGSGFGARVHPIHGGIRQHLGVDVAARTGQPVVAAAAGAVVHAGPRGGYGIAVVLDHGGGRTTLYAHLSALDVARGEQVEQADLIGRVGSTGQSTGPHLHFEVREDGRPRDPLAFFR